jgi:hypothetical protein
MCTKKDYGLHYHLLGAHSINKHFILRLFILLKSLPPGALKILHQRPGIHFDIGIHVPPTQLSVHCKLIAREHEKQFEQMSVQKCRLRFAWVSVTWSSVCG